MCIHLTIAFEFYQKKNSNIFLVGYYISNYIKHIKKRFEETQNNDVFISPIWKNAILEMSLKSSIMSKLDLQMSRI